MSISSLPLSFSRKGTRRGTLGPHCVLDDLIRQPKFTHILNTKTKTTFPVKVTPPGAGGEAWAYLSGGPPFRIMSCARARTSIRAERGRPGPGRPHPRKVPARGATSATARAAMGPLKLRRPGRCPSSAAGDRGALSRPPRQCPLVSGAQAPCARRAGSERAAYASLGGAGTGVPGSEEDTARWQGASPPPPPPVPRPSPPVAGAHRVCLRATGLQWKCG